MIRAGLTFAACTTPIMSGRRGACVAKMANLAPLDLTFYEGFDSVKVLGFWICLGSHSSIRACGVAAAAQVGGFRGGVAAPSTNELLAQVRFERTTLQGFRG
jgi:hypothetical protein